MEKHWKRWSGMFLLLLLVVPCLISSVYAAGERRVINVVYDDSGSMYGKSNDTWSQALYAMETFATMLGAEDEMNIYLMSDEGRNPICVHGSDGRRVATIEGGIRGDGNTPFQTVRAAADGLDGYGEDAEKWLVVLTDGEFAGTDDPGSELSSYAWAGNNVVYLAIGSEANALQGDAGSGFYAYKAQNSTEILSYITYIANQIFKQQVLPDNHITVQGNTMELDIDIPVKQILVFAQGEGIAVNSLKRNGTELSATEDNQVTVTADSVPGHYAGQGMAAASGLSGVVKTYHCGDTPFEKGTYELEVSDPANVEVYYIPGVDIDCVLTDSDGAEVTSDSAHYAGIYGIDMRFLDPTNGAAVSSDLLDGAQFGAVLKNGGKEIPIDESVTQIQLEEGEVELAASAVLPGNVTVTSNHTYTVFPEPLKLDVSAQVPGSGYKLSALGKKSEPILVTAKDRATGSVISKELWDAIGDTGLNVTGVCDEGSVNWLVNKGDDVGTWEIRPDYITDISDTGSGNIQLSIAVDYTEGTQAAHGSTETATFIAGYTTSELKIDIEVPEGTVLETSDQEDSTAENAEPVKANIHLADIDGSTGVLFRIYTKDEYTGEYIPLTREQFKKLDFQFSCQDEFSDKESKLKWKLGATGEDGVYELQLNMLDAEKIAYSMKGMERLVNVDVRASGSLEEDLYRYEGSAQTMVTVETMSLAAILSRVGVYLASGFLFLFVLLGLLLKKKLKWKQLKPYVQDVETGRRVEVKKKRVILSYILPWVPQRAVISLYVPALHCRFDDLHIKAAGSGQFHITNIDSYKTDHITVGGKKVSDASKKRAYAHVTLQYLDGMDNPIGKAHV